VSNSAIIYIGDDDNGYCAACDYLLYERKDGSKICSNPDCERTYTPDEVTKHKSKLGPELQKRAHAAADGDGPLLVAITDYTSPKKRSPTPGEVEGLTMA